MPELPEVEVLVRSLAPLLRNQVVRQVQVRRPKVLAPTSTRQLARALTGGRFLNLSRRGKFPRCTKAAPELTRARQLVVDSAISTKAVDKFVDCF